jgi:hypothetical protein
MQSDFKAIAKRLRSTSALTAKRSRRDCEAIAPQSRTDCAAIPQRLDNTFKEMWSDITVTSHQLRSKSLKTPKRYRSDSAAIAL